MRQLKITKSITNRDAASLDKYLVEISREGLITPSEEVELAKRIHKGDIAALDKLVRSNLRFVVSVAKQYQNQGLSLPDMINEGNLGLIKAANRFDETRGFKFISYAVWWIRQFILQALVEQARIVRLPLNKIGDIRKLNKIYSKMEQEFERNPTDEEIADTLGVSLEDVRDTIGNTGKHVSMDSPSPKSEDGTGNRYETFENPDAPRPDMDLMTEALKIEITRSLACLSHREADVVCLYFGLKKVPAKTFEEIGEMFGLTRERVRQIKEKAIRRLRHPRRSKLLKDYLC